MTITPTIFQNKLEYFATQKNLRANKYKTKKYIIENNDFFAGIGHILYSEDTILVIIINNNIKSIFVQFLKVKV